MARQQRNTTFSQESTARISSRRGCQIAEEFTDQGVSGCKESRPALNRLMADACRRRSDAVLVWKIVPFGRSLKHLVNALAELAALGVAFISLRENMDLSTPARVDGDALFVEWPDGKEAKAKIIRREKINPNQPQPA